MLPLIPRPVSAVGVRTPSVFAVVLPVSSTFSTSPVMLSPLTVSRALMSSTLPPLLLPVVVRVPFALLPTLNVS